jgi:fused signal recognition particle receptor
MFDDLQKRLGSALKRFRVSGVLTEANMRAGLQEVRNALLEADVNYNVVQEFMARVTDQAVGTEVVKSIRPEQQIVKIVHDELVELMGPVDPSIRFEKNGLTVLMLCGLQGSGKTTTCGKLARVLVGDGKTVVLGAADTFRAAAADQLQTWGERVGAQVVRSDREGADPASVAFEAVNVGIERGVDTVIVDTAGRLHTKVGLMDELGKIKRVIEKHGTVDEVLLVLDATTGQNGLRQARVFAEVVDITGIILTKLDGTAKGGIVIQVQRELGVPVKLVGLGEGPDDLAFFDPEVFVDAILAG